MVKTRTPIGTYQYLNELNKEFFSVAEVRKEELKD
jgi:hypothetical protein